MKRRALVEHLRRYECVLLQEGAKHSRFVNLADPTRIVTMPRHKEIADFLAAKICKQLGIPGPKQ